jgi:RNA polymerase sigma factor (sigma-70 family)
VYSRNIGKMIAICYRYTSNRQLSEDLAHDAFLKAIDKSSGFEGRGSFDAWLRRIVVNHALQYIRDQKKRTPIDDWLQHESDEEQPGDTSAVTTIAERADFSEQELLEVINDLPEHHRLVFNLYVIDQFTHVQIGEQLDISPGTSKSHLARARKKIKELLLQKAKTRRDEKDRERRWLLFMFPYKFPSIDRLYRKHFDVFEIAPKEILSVDHNSISTAPVKPRAIAFRNYIMATTSAGIALVVAIVIFNSYPGKTSFKTLATELAKPPINKEDSTKRLQTSKEVKRNETTNRKNKSAEVDSNTATFFPDSIILNKQTKSMKKLDSIGVMLLVSSSIAFDSIAQSEKDVRADSKSIVVMSDTRSTDSVADDEAAPAKTVKNKTKSKTEEGTFYASRLFWSGTNNELYFKGKVIAHMNDQNFIVNGSANFLGPVYLLILNGEPATLNSTMELSQQQYRLKRLSDTKAMQKYGEKGSRGAIEISTIE